MIKLEEECREGQYSTFQPYKAKFIYFWVLKKENRKSISRIFSHINLNLSIFLMSSSLPFFLLNLTKTPTYLHNYVKSF